MRILFFLLLISNITFGEESPRIVDWSEVETQKDFILSRYMFDNNKCNFIWQKQIAEFLKQNPQVKNPDKIKIGEKLYIQKCSPQKKAEPDFVKLLGEERLEYLGGVIKETGDSVTGGLGINLLGAFTDLIGYRLTTIASPSSLIYYGNVEFRSPISMNRDYYLVGLGQRVGLGNKDEDRIGDGVDSFMHLGYGRIWQNRERNYFKAEIGLNAGSKLGINAEFTWLKNRGKYWMGAFALLKSTQSFSDTENPRNIIFSGFKITY